MSPLKGMQRDVFVMYRLITTLNINDAEACVCQPDLRVQKHTTGIWAAVRNRSNHLIGQGAFDAVFAKAEYSGNTTHESKLGRKRRRFSLLGISVGR
jgi:hypothetical protein